MKFKHLLMATLFTGALASCSDDLAMDGGDKVLENQTTTYLRLSITGDAISRTDGYEVGDKAESDVSSILLTFFDAAQNYVGNATVPVSSSNTIKDEGPGDYNNTVERILTVVAQVDLPENSNHPAYVVAYVNPTAASTSLLTDRLEDAQNYIRTRESVSPDKGFRTMNNSVYFDGNGRVAFATPVDFTNQFKSTEAAAREDATSAVEITVERMEAKVRLSTPFTSLDIKGVNGDAAVGTAKYTLTFHPVAWFVNGTEKRSFLIKNFRSGDSNFLPTFTAEDKEYNAEGSLVAFPTSLSLQDLSDRFKNGGHAQGFTGFNDRDRLRSYWAIDPTYFYNGNDTYDYYPEVSYDVKYGGVNSGAKYYPLLYRSYDKAVAEYTAGVAAGSNYNSNYMAFDNTRKLHEYVLENTVSLNTVAETDAKAALTSVVLLGYYVITDASGNVVFSGENQVADTDGLDNRKFQSFYVRHEGTEKKIVMVKDKEVVDYFLERNLNLFYVKELAQDGTETGNYIPLHAGHLDSNNTKPAKYGVDYSDFSIEYPRQSVAGNQTVNESKQSEQWRTLRVHRDATTGNYTNENIYIRTSEGGYKKLTDLNGVEAEKTALLTSMYSSFGVVERFESGKAYFNVPLRHIWADLTSTANAAELAKSKLGDYGVVRNHVYDLSIGEIKGLGTGIGDITQPIVPPTENTHYFVKVKLNILQWRLVGQTVNL